MENLRTVAKNCDFFTIFVAALRSCAAKRCGCLGLRLAALVAVAAAVVNALQRRFKVHARVLHTC